MQMEKGLDALECRDRCLAAIVTTADLETAQALWRAAGRFNQRIREERADHRLKVGPPHRAAAGGEVPAGAQARYEF
jgi:hypothetical protein